MCRSILEHPPAGLRCDKRDHLSPQAAEAKRLARNAREKQLYYIRKARRAGEAETPTPEMPVAPDTVTSVPEVADPYEKEREHHRKISQNKDILSQGENDEFAISTQTERDQVAALLNTDQGGLAYMKVSRDDPRFKEEANTTNDVYRLILEDGTAGYFKSYEGAVTADYLGSTGEYGHTFLGSVLNEVAAYRLSQALGDGYDTLVPETVFREYNGEIGTFQKEAKGSVGHYDSWKMSNPIGQNRVDAENLRKAAIYDFISGAQDRHKWNYIVDESKNPYSITLIDNGFSFHKKSAIACSQELIQAYTDTASEPLTLTSSEREHFTKLLQSPNLEGVADLISSDSADRVRARLSRLLEDSSEVDLTKYII